MHALETGNADVAALSGLSYTFVTPSQIRVYCFFCKALIMGFDVNRGWFKTTPRNAVPSIYTKELWFLISRTQGCFNSGHWHDYSRNWAMAHPKVQVSKTTPGYRMYSMRASSVMLNPARFDRALYTGPLRLETPSDGNCHALVTSCGASIGTWNMMMPSSSRFTVPVFTLVAAFPSFYRIVHPLPSPVDIKTVM